MKLLYLSGAPTVSTDEKAQSGGPRAHILGIISGFKAHGWTVTEFIFGNRFKDRLKNSPPAIQLSRNFLLRLASDLFRVFIGLVNQRKVASSFPGFNLCYERFAAFQALGAGLKKRLGTPWILETNGIYFLEAKKDRRSIVMSSLCRKLEEKAYQECDYLVLISEDLRNLVLHHFRVSPDKILVIPNGVDTERFKPAAGPPAKGTNAFTIGFVGGLIDWCGLGGLFEAVALLKKDLPVPVNLVVAGDGISKDRFISKCKQLGLENSVAFLGNRPWDEIPELIESFDVCFSGQVETHSGKMYHSPLKIYEYLAMGKPVIASNFQDAKATIVPGFNGHLFEPGNTSQILDCLRKTYGQLTKGGFNSAAIRKQIVENHSWEARVRFLMEKISPKGASL